MVQTVGSGGGGGNGHAAGLTWAPSKAGGRSAAERVDVAAVNAAATAAGTPWIWAGGKELLASLCQANRWLTSGLALMTMPPNCAFPRAMDPAGAPPGICTCGGTSLAHTPTTQYWYSSSGSASVSTKYRPSTRAM